MCIHDSTICKACGANSWKLFNGLCGHFEVKCAECGRNPKMVLVRQKRTSGALIHFRTIRDKKLSELMPGDIPPGLDAEDLVTDFIDPEELTKI